MSPARRRRLQPRRNLIPSAVHFVQDLRSGRCSLSPANVTTIMKKPTKEERERMCTRKRKFRSQGDALDAALLAGVERRLKAYLCPLCGQWHLTSG